MENFRNTYLTTNMKNIIGSLDQRERTVYIWGAGFSGLVLCHYLKKAGWKVTIYEKENRAGGKIQTLKTPFGPSETGANAIFLNYDGLELLKDLKLEIISAAPKLKRKLFLDNKISSPFKLSLLLRVLPRLLSKPPRITEGLSVADFFKPLLGQRIVHDYLSTVLGGVYATGAENLHFKSIFPEVQNTIQFKSYWDFFKTLIRHKKAQPQPEIKGSASFEGGMSVLVDRLYELHKDDIRLSSHEDFYPKKNTFICTDAQTASVMVANYAPAIASELKLVTYQHLSSVTVFLKRQIRDLHQCFGVLIPRGNKFLSSGILNNKAIFPINNPNVYAYTFISHEKLTPEEILKEIQHLQDDMTQDDIEFIQNNYWDRAIPLYNVNRSLAINRLHELTQTNKIGLFGNYVAGISLREMISAAKNFAQNNKFQGV